MAATALVELMREGGHERLMLGEDIKSVRFAESNIFSESVGEGFVAQAERILAFLNSPETQAAVGEYVQILKRQREISKEIRKRARQADVFRY